MEEVLVKQSPDTEAKNRGPCGSSSILRNNLQSTNPQMFEILAQTPLIENGHDDDNDDKVI